MKNFLIIVFALGLIGSAYLTRPDREEFERYVLAHTVKSDNDDAAKPSRKEKRGKGIDRNLKDVAVKKALDNVEFKDFYLWTVVRKDGKTLFTGVFDRWIENEKVKGIIPS